VGLGLAIGAKPLRLGHGSGADQADKRAFTGRMV
jgi:hypothetical protein